MSADTATQFYDELADWYHLVYPDWNASISRQAAALDQVIQRELGPGDKRILDVACGIGTQSLGLAALGYEVVASDISANAVKRAKREAAARGLRLELSVADMRVAHGHHTKQFDVVLCADNSLPHLLSDDEILAALRQFHACTKPGGLCLVSAMDYGKEERGGAQFKPYGVRVENGQRYILFQTWDWRGDLYDVSLYLVRDQGASTCDTTTYRSTYYAIPVERTCGLLAAAGFVHVARLDDTAYFQPIIVARRSDAR
jgi:2-polyprenyl-3-methyl-5-hydroxy-6-metoxy-1,4-benzoquinol methylase